MHTRIKILMTALVAALALTALAGTATALRSLSLSPAGPENPLTLNSRGVTFESGLGNIICSVTLTKTLSRAIPKIQGTLIGRITRVDINNAGCRSTIFGFGGVVWRALTEREERWRLFYKSILGTLPSITGGRIEIREAAIEPTITIFGSPVSCLFNGTIDSLADVGPRGEVRNLHTISRESETQNVRKVSGGELCPNTAVFIARRAEGEFVPLQAETIRLL